MPGNESNVVAFLVNNMNTITLKHIGTVNKITSPINNNFIEINNTNDLVHIHQDDARKKADIYINDIGVSIKQSGGCNAFNRLQRAEILNIFTKLKIPDPTKILATIDKLIHRYHEGTLVGTRSRCWNEAFSESGFKTLAYYLMMLGSPNYGDSNFPAKLILVAPSSKMSEKNIAVYTFDEYFERYKNSLKLSIRCSRIGQLSKTEHNRAVSLAKKPGNLPWVLNGEGSRGQPRANEQGKRWRDEYPPNKRKSAYYIMIENVK